MYTRLLFVLLLFVGNQVFAQTYCIPNYTFTPFGCSDISGGDVIDDFWTTGGITNITNMNTGCNGDHTVFNLTATQTMGQSIQFNLQSGPTYAQGYRIWIDYTNDGDFQDANEDVWASAQATTNAQNSGSYTIPLTVTPGIKRLRIVGRFSVVPSSTDDCNQNMSYGECEDYFINILPLADYDPAVYFISQPIGNCFSANQQFQVRLKNYGSLPIVLSPTNYITLYLQVNGPAGVVNIDTTLTSGTIPALGVDSIVALFQTAFNNAANLYPGGTYSINTWLTCTGFTNGLVSDDSLQTPIVVTNYRPTAGPTYNLCQGSSIPFGEGLTVSGCATPLSDSVTITFTVTPTADNIGATGFGTTTGAPANCANVFAGTLGTGILPALPPGAYFTQPAKLVITNISSGFPTECRFNLFGSIPDGPTLYSGCPTPYNVGAGDINVGGVSVGPANNFNHTRNIPPSGISAMYSNLPPGGTVRVGYFELWNDDPGNSDIGYNAGSTPTTVTLKIYYQYVPPSFEWFDTPVGGTSLYSLSPFNPLSVTNAVVNNSNTPGTYVFYAACVGSSTCRIPDTLKILPAPSVFQDSLFACENAPSSNTAIVDLTTLNSSVSGGFTVDSINYFYDQANLSLVTPATNDTTGSIVLYSKVYLGQCASSDSVLVFVNNSPEIALLTNSPIICAPNVGNILDYINPFSFSPPTTDTFYFQDGACTQPYVNPFLLNTTDSIYVVMATNTSPVCADTVGLLVDVSTSSNLIVNQNNFNISNCSTTDPIITAFKNFNDGQTQDVYNTSDCRKIVGISDYTNGIALGNVSVDETIDCPNMVYNSPEVGFPLLYMNRHFTITPSVEDSAQVCLYFLEDDVASYNFDAVNLGYPQISVPNLTNLAVYQFHGGNILDTSANLTLIPPADITVTYNATYSVYSGCFHVDSFSNFYLAPFATIASPLGVQWKEFTAVSRLNMADLTWITSQERNASYYVVERSSNGKEFNTLSGQIPSLAPQGNSDVPLRYTFTDSKPFTGRNYYRIKQFDLDGKFSYSEIRAVNFGAENTVTLYPNPVEDKLNVEIFATQNMEITLQVLDVTGRIISTQSQPIEAGTNTIALQMNPLAAGLYKISVSNGKGFQYHGTVRKSTH